MEASSLPFSTVERYRLCEQQYSQVLLLADRTAPHLPIGVTSAIVVASRLPSP